MAPTRLEMIATLLAAGALLLPHGALEAKSKHGKRPSSRAIPVTPRPPDPYRVTIPTADGVALAASWRPVPGVPDAPAVLLIHEFSRDRREWNALVPELLAQGLAALAIDLRGHGESLRKAGFPVRLSPRLMNDPSGFPRDVQAACAWLRQRAPRVGVMGLSVGANLTVLATASNWADAGVAISAVTKRFAALAGILPTTPQATFLIASEDDPGRAAAARELFERQAEPRKALVVPGAAHGLVLFAQHPDTKREALAWLVERLDAVPPPAAPSAPLPASTVPATR